MRGFGALCACFGRIAAAGVRRVPPGGGAWTQTHVVPFFVCACPAFSPSRPADAESWCGEGAGTTGISPRQGLQPHSPMPTPRPRAHSSLRAHCQGIDERPLRAMDTDGVEITGQKGDDTMRKAPHARFDCVVRLIRLSAPRPAHLATTTPIRRAARLPPALFHARSAAAPGPQDGEAVHGRGRV